MTMRRALLAAATLTLTPALATAASCCGGGSSGSLLLPKFSRAMVDASLAWERYDGFWNKQGEWTPDPAGSDLNQYRLAFGYAHRLAPRWQLGVSVPYVWNDNRYGDWERNTHGVGDTTISLWYEAFDRIMCVWKVKELADLKPAVYWGASLTLPTGTSPYDEVEDNFDITGRGFYRLDASLMLDKTVYPWSATFSASYGVHLERPVNREYGTYVEPYDRKLGDRFSASLSGGYTLFTEAMESLTATLAYSYLEEQEGTIDGVTDTTSGLRKESFTTTLAWASDDRDWVVKLSWSRGLRVDGWGSNFPVTDVLSLGVSHVLR